MELVLTICNIVASIIGALYAYRVIFGVLGAFCTKRFQPAKKQHKYAIVIAARNEETVIGNLLDSITDQDYPKELLTTFVVADNCTDRTAQISRQKGAICYERNDPLRRTKGYALEFLFDRIEEDFGRETFEGYFVFDADNLLKRDFVSRMNDSFDSGEQVVVSYRNTKNLGDGWLSASYALHWLRTCRLEHCARSFLGISGRIQGTGFLFASSFVKEGWHYTSLTEDRSFSSDIVTMGVRISYQHEAQFYDEQPNSLRIALRQRLRWAKGNLQAFTETGWDLFCGIFQKKGIRQKLSCYDMLLFNFPSSAATVSLKLIEATVIVILCVTAGNLSKEWFSLLINVLYILVFEHFSAIITGFAVLFLERKRLKKLRWYQYIWYSVMLSTFGMIGDIVTLIAIFRKVTWEPIPHNADISIRDLQEADSK
ncbi:MAG: glycosyltransferase family 2 protein [Clostridia bacterium]|nr:glycosyltransferase family 2 protein [Clostridia bacterium]